MDGILDPRAILDPGAKGLDLRHYQPGDLQAFRAGEAGIPEGFLSDPALAHAMEGPRAFTGLWDGRVIGCAAVYHVWPGRAGTWALFSSSMPRRAWPGITRHVLAVLDEAHAAGYRRIECSVRADFNAAIAWAVRLGFEPASLEPFYGPDGASHVLFRRLR